jgi:hypothetical protein
VAEDHPSFPPIKQKLGEATHNHLGKEPQWEDVVIRSIALAPPLFTSSNWGLHPILHNTSANFRSTLKENKLFVPRTKFHHGKNRQFSQSWNYWIGVFPLDIDRLTFSVAGLCQAIALKRKLGHNNFTIWEQESTLGGTWYLIDLKLILRQGGEYISRLCL